MNINPKTGKIWVNNYLNMYGTIFSNQNHKYIQLDRYYDIIGKLEGRTKAAYAMILHSHMAQVTCNRSPGVHANIFMYIDTKSGVINNSTEMKEWMCKSGWLNCNGEHLLDIASQEIWWVVYKSMMDVGLIKTQAGTLRVMIPIEGRFLPIPYAHVAFLSRVKRDSELSKAVVQALADTPDKIRTNLENLPKEDLIDELIKVKTENLIPSRNSEVYKMLMEEIQAKHPHQWGKNPEKNRENFLEKISENFSEIIPEKNPEKKSEINSENNPTENTLDFPGEKTVEEIVELIPEKISQDKSKKEKSKTIQKVLPVDQIHNFESNKKLRGPRNISPDLKSEPQEIDLASQAFFADELTANDMEKLLAAEESQEKIVEKIPENKLEENFDLDDIPDLPQDSFDIFGLPIEQDYDTQDVIEMPESISESIPIGLEAEDMDEFWCQE